MSIKGIGYRLCLVMVSSLQAQTSLPPIPGAQPAEVTIVPKGGKLPPLSFKSVQFPNYPALAKIARIESVVKVLVDIDFAGSINNVQFVDGRKQLFSTVLKAVTQWQFHESNVNHVPIEFHFLLSPTTPETVYRINFEPGCIVIVISAKAPTPSPTEQLPVMDPVK